MSRTIPARLMLALTLALALGTAGCQELPAPETCGEIPEGGCPVGRGGSCDDVTCTGLYDCVEGAWALAKTCTGGGDGGSGGSGGGVADAGPDACTPVTIDHTGETTGCTPDLQHPDCPAVAAERCAETACLTGCIDFFLCTADGWTTAAYCTDEGELHVGP